MEDDLPNIFLPELGSLEGFVEAGDGLKCAITHPRRVIEIVCPCSIQEEIRRKLRRNSVAVAVFTGAMKSEYLGVFKTH